MSALLRKNSHQLLKGSSWNAQFELNFQPVAIDKVCSERSVVERVKPVPALNSFVIVRVHPRKSFAVRLPYSDCQVVLFFVCTRMELLAIITLAPSLNAELDLVNVFRNELVILRFRQPLDLFLDCFCYELLFFLF